MTIELDSTLAQAEVLFLSFAQLVSDLDQRKAEAEHQSQELRRRKPPPGEGYDGSPRDEEAPSLTAAIHDSPPPLHVTPFGVRLIVNDAPVDHRPRPSCRIRRDSE